MNNHQLIEKYTKLVMQRLYNQDVQVFFRDMWEKPLRALFREKGLYPYYTNEPGWDKNKCNITFHNKIFRISGELPPHTWDTIVHEVSHFEVDMVFGKKGLRHPKSFNDLYKGNKRKVRFLKKEFMDELDIVSCIKVV